MMHGNDWTGQDLAGWWLSEKLDGHRCLWTGREFQTRSGKVLKTPAAWLLGMPDTPLDGELVTGKTSHDAVQSALLRRKWGALRFVAFDVMGGTIEAAVTALASLDLPSHCGKVTHRRVASTAEAVDAMHRIVANGGEGVMLRKPGSRYVDYRTDDLLKLKP